MVRLRPVVKILVVKDETLVVSFFTSTASVAVAPFDSRRDQMIGHLDEFVPVCSEGVPFENLQHFGPSAFQNGYACKERWTDVERQDRMFRRVVE